MLAVAAFTGLLLAALLVEPLAKRLRLPFSLALVFVGFIGSELYVALGGDTGLRWYHFTELILHVFLPVLVFESAFHLNARELFKHLIPILYLAVPLLVVATFVTGALIYLGIHHPTGFPWLVALLTGALLSATDPVAVVGLFKELGAPRRLHILLEGESLFNDATAIVLFTLLLTLATMPAEAVSMSGAIAAFVRVFLGGIGAGIVVGAVGIALLRLFTASIACAIITVATAVFSVYVAEHVFHFSGVMAVLASGLMMGESNRRRNKDEFTSTLWEFNAYIANALIFLLVGVTITVQMFTSQWLAMVIGIGAVLATRMLIVYALLTPVQWLPGIAPIPLQHRTVMLWGGLRGAVTLALALSLPLELDAWFTVQSIAYGVVLFTLLLQAPSMEPLLRYLKLTSST